MNDRERLIELLSEASKLWVQICDKYAECDICPANKDKFHCRYGVTADHLIANGVTFATDKNDGGKKTSKQKIKDILDWVQSTAEVDWGFMCCLKQELEQLVAIASRDDAFGGKWISVTDRLPEKDGSYLTVNKQNSILQLTFFKDFGESSDCDLWGKKNIWCDYDSEYGYYECLDITHWMPLPEQPEGD